MISEKYRTIAAGCENWAANAADPDVRNDLLILASKWRRLAEKAERQVVTQRTARLQLLGLRARTKRPSHQGRTFTELLHRRATRLCCHELT
jgi:hypothetical protein